MNKTLETLEGWKAMLGPIGPWVTALLIIVLGYFVAKVISGIIRKALGQTSLDDKLASMLGQDTDGCERAISQFIFWILMLFVVVFALGAAEQTEVVQPLRDLLDEFVGYIPNLLAAVVIGLLAWIFATVVKNLLVGLLSASRVDERLGLGDSRPITNSVGLVAFFGIIMMLIPNALDQLGWTQISEPIGNMVSTIFGYIPNLLAGIIIFAIGFLVATIVQKVLSGVLSGIGADALPAKLGYTGGDLGGKPLSSIIGYIAMATILVIISAQALTTMDLGFISELATGFVPGFLKILLALIIFGAAFFIANIVGQLVEGKSQFWARVVRIGIIVFLGAVALQKANISDLTNDTFQLVITSLIIAAAFAAGVGGAIAIGLGGREKAGQWLGRIK